MKKTRVRTLVAAAAALASVSMVGLAGTATAGTVNPASGAAGSVVGVGGLCAGLEVTVTVAFPSGNVVATTGGLVAYNVPIAIPAGTPPGAYPVSVVCGVTVIGTFTQTDSATGTLTVTAPVVTTPPDTTTTPELTGFGFDTFLDAAEPVFGTPRFTG